MNLREACIARGLNPDGYRVPKLRHLAIERIIPGKPDAVSPNMSGIGAALRGNARKMYTRGAAATDASIIEQARASGEETAAYVAAFCRLNNLKE